jgi:hypothetical protein
MLLSKDGKTLICYPAASGTVTLNEIETVGYAAFDNCNALRSVNLPAATTIGGNAFWNCTTLTTVNLPAATSIGVAAFHGCGALSSVNLPAATSIGSWAFAYTGDTALTVTLGAAPPSVEMAMFLSVSAAKTVTVKVPSGATGYGTIPGTYSGADTNGNWGNGFRGGGWNGSAMTDSSKVNGNITLSINYIP